MSKRAYRFVPLGAGGDPNENSHYTLITTDELRVGDELHEELLGYSNWEVIEFREETKPLLGARDVSGADIPLAGTVVCRGIA